MITLLNGDNVEASRGELNRLKLEAKGREMRTVEGRSVDSGTLVQSLESSSLFSITTLIIIEQLFGKLGRQTKKISEYSGMLAKAGKDADIIIWEDKELGEATIKQLGPGVTVRLFKLPVLIFQFLDTLSLSMFERLCETEPPELVFSMLVKRVRQLISPPEGLADWQLARLTRQAKSFTMNERISLYGKLGEAEYAIKSGSSPFTFRQLLEQVLLSV